MKPALVYASRRAARQAAELLPGVCLERIVQNAISSGRVLAGNGGGFVYLDDEQLVASVERRPGRIRPRGRQWLVVNLQLLEVEHDGNPAKR